MQKIIEEAIKNSEKYIKNGKVATYIPELEKMNKNNLGVAITDLEGDTYGYGDYREKFTLQSMSKPLTLLLIQNFTDNKIFDKVGKEPTGDAFNSIIRLETFVSGKPLNPLINAGAITVTSELYKIFKKDTFKIILDFFKKISGNNQLKVNEKVYLSEKRTGARNRSIAYFLSDNKVIEDDVEEILDIYFKQCSVEIDCVDLSIIGATVANKGINPVSKEQIFESKYSKIVMSLMTTCGMYDSSGAFAYSVGIPSKSGVSGGILSSIPNKCGIGTFSPALDKKGNSVAGIKVLEKISTEMNLNIFN